MKTNNEIKLSTSKIALQSIRCAEKIFMMKILAAKMFTIKMLTAKNTQ